jgi:hypothetical protein
LLLLANSNNKKIVILYTISVCYAWALQSFNVMCENILLDIFAYNVRPYSKFKKIYIFKFHDVIKIYKTIGKYWEMADVISSVKISKNSTWIPLDSTLIKSEFCGILSLVIDGNGDSLLKMQMGEYSVKKVSLFLRSWNASWMPSYNLQSASSLWRYYM